MKCTIEEAASGLTETLRNSGMKWFHCVGQADAELHVYCTKRCPADYRRGLENHGWCGWPVKVIYTGKVVASPAYPRGRK